MDEFIAWMRETFQHPVYDTEATHNGTLRNYPYFLVLGSDTEPHEEDGLRSCAVFERVETVTIRCVHIDAPSARALQKTFQAKLSPIITTPTQVIQHEWLETRAAIADTSVSIVGIQKHPVFVDEVLRLWIQPVKEH